MFAWYSAWKELEKVKYECGERNVELERTVADQKQKIEYLHSRVRHNIMELSLNAHVLQCRENESAFQKDLSHLEKSCEWILAIGHHSILWFSDEEKLNQMTQAMEQIENEKLKVEETLNKERQERSLASYNR